MCFLVHAYTSIYRGREARVHSYTLLCTYKFVCVCVRCLRVRVSIVCASYLKSYIFAMDVNNINLIAKL